MRFRNVRTNKSETRMSSIKNMLLVSRELKVGVIKLIHAHESKKTDRESQVKRCRRESLAKVAIVALFMFLDPL